MIIYKKIQGWHLKCHSAASPKRRKKKKKKKKRTNTAYWTFLATLPTKNRLSNFLYKEKKVSFFLYLLLGHVILYPFYKHTYTRDNRLKFDVVSFHLLSSSLLSSLKTSIFNRQTRTVWLISNASNAFSHCFLFLLFLPPFFFVSNGLPRRRDEAQRSESNLYIGLFRERCCNDLRRKKINFVKKNHHTHICISVKVL